VRFVRDGTDLIAPFSLTIDAGDTRDLPQPTGFSASLAARVCGAIVRPTSGTIYVGDYETRLQPPQAKRRVGFVDVAGFDGDAHAFACEVAFHAQCWGIARRLARERAARILDALARDDAYARALALALVADVDLIVLDQPPDDIVSRVRALAPTSALLATRVA
jgi:ABC-type multidrug transport system ATPase subunit